jgi:hypothetical protein
VPWGAQVSVGADPRFAKIQATVQEWNDAGPLGDAPSRNSSRDWNGTLAAYYHVLRRAKPKREAERTQLPEWALTKRYSEVEPPRRTRFFPDAILRRLLLRVSLAKSPFLLCDSNGFAKRSLNLRFVGTNSRERNTTESVQSGNSVKVSDISVFPPSQAENVIRMAQASARRLALQYRFG